jgi:hypothetical protein
MRTRFPIVALLLTAHTAFAQRPDQLHGTFAYEVIGYYQGEAMEPWLAQRIVRDTTIDKKTWLAVTYQSRLAPTGWLYSYTALLSGHDVRTHWVGNGRMPYVCDAVREGDRIAAKMGERGSATSPLLKRDAVPDFALATVLAGRPLADGDSVHFHVFRCSPGADTPVPSFDLNAVVTSGTFARKESGSPEAVWIVTGDKGFPYAVQIAKSDRRVLKVTMPQGTDGEMIEVYVEKTQAAPTPR